MIVPRARLGIGAALPPLQSAPQLGLVDAEGTAHAADVCVLELGLEPVVHRQWITHTAAAR